MKRRARRNAWLIALVSAFVAAGIAGGVLGAGFFGAGDNPKALGKSASDAPVNPVAPAHGHHSSLRLVSGGSRTRGLKKLSPAISLAGIGSSGTISVAVGRSLEAGPPGPPAPPPATPPTGPSGSAEQIEVNTQASLAQQLSSLSWATETSGTSNQLNAVDAVDPTHVWAAGANCTILFSANGTSWAPDTHVPATCTSGNVSLTGINVQGGAGPGWAVGSGGTILECTTACNAATAVWSALTPGSVVGGKDGSLTLNSTTATSNSLFTTNYAGWAITDSSGKIPSGTTIVSVNTTAHTAVLSNKATGTVTMDTFTVTAPASVLPPSNLNFTSVWAADANHVYAVGTTTGGAGAIWACSNGCNQTAVVGPTTGSPPPPPPPGAVATWANVTPSGLGSTALNGVEGQGAGFAIAVGSNGTILVCGGTPAPPAGATCATSGTAWLPLGSASTVGGPDGSLATASGTTTATSNSLFATSYAGWSITDSQGKIPAGTTIVSVNTTAHTAVLSKTAANATGDTFTVTAPSSVLPPSTVTFTSVWAADNNHVYAVGRSGGSGVIWACNNNCNQATTSGPTNVPSPPTLTPAPPPAPAAGAAWANITPVAAPPVKPYVVPPALNSVSGQGPNNAWAVGTGGAIFTCTANCTTEPTAWVELSPSFPTAQTLFGVAAVDPNHVWAVGAAGTIVAALNPTANANGVANAIGDLGVALNPLLWSGSDGNHLVTSSPTAPPAPPPPPAPNTGQQMFQNLQQAVQQLMTVTTTSPPGPPPPPPPPGNPSWDVAAMTNLDYSAWLVAQIATCENTVSPANAGQLTTAQNELTNGNTAFDNGMYDQAVMHYQNAWSAAIQAMGSPVATCAGVGGFTVSPTGAPTLTATNLVPGDSVSDSGTPVVVTNTGAVPLSVSIYGENIVNTTCSGCPAGVGNGILASQLQLTIVDQTTGHTVYAGLLGSINFSASPLALPGASSSTWAAGETHTFVFTVSLPFSSSNAFQKTGASLDFVWKATG